MKFQKFRQYFSAARTNRYLQATSNDKVRTVKLYKANLKVLQSFHPLIGVLEVVLRNRINDVLSSYFTDPDWIINQRTGFMIDPSLKGANNFLKREIENTEKRLKKNGAVITSGKIIAEQTLGFWTDLYETYRYKLLKGRPIQIFSAIPSGYGRKEICYELNKVRIFRNRVNHNEPICFNGSGIDFTYANDVYLSIVNVLNWIDPDLIKFIKDINKVNKHLRCLLTVLVLKWPWLTFKPVKVSSLQQQLSTYDFRLTTKQATLS